MAISMGLTMLFSAFMIPAWARALAELEPRPASVATGVGIAYTMAYLLFVAIGSWQAWVVRAVLCLALIGLGGFLVVLMGLANSWVLVFALCVIAVTARREVTVAATVLALAGLAVGALLTGGSAEQLSNIVILGSVTTATALLVWLIDTNEELRRTRDQVALLAVDRERERVARDLHDILGHSLTTITVKAGLVRRLLESGGDLDVAVREIGDVERLSRRSLADVRATVSGYRQITLAGELASAREVLRAAGMEAELPRAVDHVDPALHEVFGHIVREAVTNAVRHSSARRVTVAVGRNWLRVEDDGVGANAARWGNGLRGLAERLRAVDGTLEAGTRPEGGFFVHAAAPAVE
ncbi:two-component sensor histidine kinase [Thermopolyspora flexuosa]|jgi:two-component system sensor histidine kinase DesK|uniref:Two-component system sensor histidine kinase DesK n=1 Tax=Thermopolyspora flexuosa TaxID=103836 RepID=A0A543IYQ5_9ACTN|nr:histidine kinase [Thermopolyspora flexuosa]TQM75710.1 two-component system sensor histidine kinase DesK [Thermopolyspora flexuosa]GGM61455.1 two-component sensor histidine kinase [Thermopolyspora flexuosa]